MLYCGIAIRQQQTIYYIVQINTNCSGKTTRLGCDHFAVILIVCHLVFFMQGLINVCSDKNNYCVSILFTAQPSARTERM